MKTRTTPSKLMGPTLAMLIGTAVAVPFISPNAQAAGPEWFQVATNPAVAPPARVFHGMVYDPVRHVCLLHGGVGGAPSFAVMADTWSWDGKSWTLLTQAGGPAGWGSGFAFDPDRGVAVMMLFGGFDVRGSGPVDTWEFDGTQWRQAATNGPPGARQFPILGYDPVRQAVLLAGGGQYAPFGGSDFKYFNDVWEWNGTAWTEITPAGLRPLAVLASAGAYDSQRGRLVRFGGSPDGPNRTVSDQTWEYGLPVNDR